MQYLNKSRGSGKTIGLIYASEATGFPIVVVDSIRKKHVQNLAKEMGCNIPDPIMVSDIREKRGYHPYDCFVDDAETIIEKALEYYLNSKVHSVTLSIAMSDNTFPFSKSGDAE